MELFPPRGQQLCGAREHGGVQVVSAGVHGTVDGGERHRGLLDDRQTVHVAAQQHRRTRSAAAQHRGDRVQRGAQADLQRQSVEGLQHPLLGARQGEAQLGDPVQVVAQPDQVRGQRESVVVQGHRYLQ